MNSSSTPLPQSGTATPASETDLEWWTQTQHNQAQGSNSPSECGSDADDEKGTLTRALPAPPTRPRKGLRGDTDEDALDEPSQDRLTFPEYVTKHDEDTRNISSRLYRVLLGDPDDIQSTKKFRKSRKAELVRRLLEVLLLGLVAIPILCRNEADVLVLPWPSDQLKFSLSFAPVVNGVALAWHIVFIPALSLLYIVKLLALPLTSEGKLRIGSVIIPTTFDPAPLLYPTFVPPLVAASVTGPGDVFIANCVFGLAAIPSRLVPHIGGPGSVNIFHWILTLAPIWTYGLPDGIYSSLYPLLCTLLPSLQYLTTTSLLRSELRLLAIALLNVGLFSQSPHMKILSIILWVGGLGLFTSCLYVLKWNVALERIPRWRLKRAVHVVKATNSFWSNLAANLNLAARSSHRAGHDASRHTQRSQLNARASFPSVGDRDPLLAADKRKRSSTIALPTVSAPKNVSDIKPSRSRAYRKLSTRVSQWCYLMTPSQAETKKWLYAGYTYSMIIFIILGPLRYLIGVQALSGQEPFGWAIGYLFGELELVQTTVADHGLRNWVPLPSRDITAGGLHGRIELLRHGYFGTSNTRLLLFGYWATVLAGGIGVVLRLSTSVEVDTRRKVFHGMMVVMLLPTAYVDPSFVALGLTLVLAVFLLLDLIRAAQLRPLSKPLALFLTPFVDGRDLRGPVVVSHIFLLIGCAIPLWLALASVEGTGQGAWTGWELATRDVSIVAGVICVGMGDAAASLIGRRYGRHKWPWPGGKSLEGSLAFAAAVTAGLLFARIWLDFGQWQQTWEPNGSLVSTVGRAWLAGCGASMTEALLTGCNDNVVVPVILWLLVRGLRV